MVWYSMVLYCIVHYIALYGMVWCDLVLFGMITCCIVLYKKSYFMLRFIITLLFNTPMSTF